MIGARTFTVTLLLRTTRMHSSREIQRCGGFTNKQTSKVPCYNYVCGNTLPTPHAPSLLLFCPLATSTASPLTRQKRAGGVFHSHLRHIPRSLTSSMASLQPRWGFVHASVGLEHFGCIRKPVGTKCRHLHSTLKTGQFDMDNGTGTASCEKFSV